MILFKALGRFCWHLVVNLKTMGNDEDDKTVVAVTGLTHVYIFAALKMFE